MKNFRTTKEHSENVDTGVGEVRDAAEVDIRIITNAGTIKTTDTTTIISTVLSITV